MPFAADTFDLATCFGTLHHIPNVSQVLRELYRVMKPGGFALIREPAISMGDWTRPRPGLTRNERGLPFSWLTKTSREIGFQIRRSTACVFPAIGLIAHKLRGQRLAQPRLDRLRRPRVPPHRMEPPLLAARGTANSRPPACSSSCKSRIRPRPREDPDGVPAHRRPPALPPVCRRRGPPRP
ncbi:MAG: class I SAM-dependent methyltransferase [Kiritimatiellia bacterium]